MELAGRQWLDPTFPPSELINFPENYGAGRDPSGLISKHLGELEAKSTSPPEFQLSGQGQVITAANLGRTYTVRSVTRWAARAETRP